MEDADQGTASLIYKLYEKPEEFRDHLGASLIGNPCERYLWYSFRWVMRPQIEGRIKRLFDTGHREEARLIEELRRVGVELHTRERDGKQISCRDESGHFGGSVDGIGKGFKETEQWALFECKTAKESDYNSIVKHGVEKSKPSHYDQMQTYMGMMSLSCAVYFAYCKNNDKIYTELIKYDEKAFKSLLDKANRVIKADRPPLRISDDPANFGCKFCDFRDVCHNDWAALSHCRTCISSTPVMSGKWHCTKRLRGITSAEQRGGCDQFLMIPDLVQTATAVDYGDTFIEYADKATGELFIHGKKPVDTLASRRSEGKKIASNNGLPFDDEIPF